MVFPPGHNSGDAADSANRETPKPVSGAGVLLAVVDVDPFVLPTAVVWTDRASARPVRTTLGTAQNDGQENEVGIQNVRTAGGSSIYATWGEIVFRCY